MTWKPVGAGSVWRPGEVTPEQLDEIAALIAFGIAARAQARAADLGTSPEILIKEDSQ